MPQSEQLFETYCIDTSAIFDLKLRWYRKEIFDLSRIEALIKAGTIIAPKEVLKEVERKHPSVYDWLRGLKIKSPTTTQKQLAIVAEIMRDHPKIVNHKSKHDVADPYIIAMAEERGWVVLTSEQNNGPGSIPRVCGHRDVDVVDWPDFFERQGWRFEVVEKK